MLRVERVDVERFHRSRDEWNRLVDRMPRPPIFCTWEWIHTWWTHFGKATELIVLFIYREDALVGIVPLASRTMHADGSVLKGRVLDFCGSRDLYSDHMDVISAGTDAAECLDAAMRFLRTEYREWDVMQLSYVADDSALIAFVRGGSSPFPVSLRLASTAAFIPLEAGFSGFRETLSRGGRHNLKRLQSRLHGELGAVYAAPNPESIPNAVAEVFDLHNRRATQKGTASNFQGEQLMRFHSDVATLANEAGNLRLRFVRSDGVAIATWYCFQVQHRVFTYQQGFDPEWENRSVARVLLYDLIEEACKDGIKEIDMLRGGWEYKSHWTSQRRDLMTVTLYNHGTMGRLIQATDRGRDMFATVAKRLLRRNP